MTGRASQSAPKWGNSDRVLHLDPKGKVRQSQMRRSRLLDAERATDITRSPAHYNLLLIDTPHPVIPVRVGIHFCAGVVCRCVDPGLRRDDEMGSDRFPFYSPHFSSLGTLYKSKCGTDQGTRLPAFARDISPARRSLALPRHTLIFALYFLLFAFGFLVTPAADRPYQSAASASCPPRQRGARGRELLQGRGA